MKLACTLVLSPLALLLAFGCAPEENERLEGPPGRPNIILILADDMRADDLRHMPKTNAALVEKGLEFRNAFVTYPLCCPSRVTILRGQYAHNHSVMQNSPPEGGYVGFHRSGAERKTIATLLENAGYETAFFGKYMNGYGAGANDSVPPGWTEWHAKLGGKRINDNGRLTKIRGDPPVVEDDVVRQRATAFIEGVGENPFFMHISTKAPHSGAVVAERYRELFAEEEVANDAPAFNEGDVSDKPAYIRERATLSDAEVQDLDRYHRYRLRTLQVVDDLVSRVVAALSAKGELDDTYIWFTSDNGLEMGEHRLLYNKQTPYGESIRVPLVVRGPDVSEGTESARLVLNNDLAPTFAALAGTSMGGADGRSLLPLLEGESTSWRDAFLLENRKDLSLSDIPTYEAVRTQDYLYVEYEGGERELYDLNADPYELENSYPDADPTLLAKMHDRLEALKSCKGETCRIAENRPTP